MVLTDFSFLRGEYVDPALVPVQPKTFPPSPVIHLAMNPAEDDDAEARPAESTVKPLFPTPPSASAVVASVPTKAETSDLAARALRLRVTTPRIKSFSASGASLERMAPLNPAPMSSTSTAVVATRPRKARPYSTGDIEDLRRVAISGFSKNKNGTWMFKVDVGYGLDSYAVRRRFSDFRELHEGLQELVHPSQLPELPHHGLYSVVQLFFSPEPALNQRAKKLEELLQFVNQHPVLSMSVPYTKFLGKNPSSPDVGYVSLSCYEAPTPDNSFRLSCSRGRARRGSS